MRIHNLKIFAVILSLVLVACCLVACGDKDGETPDPNNGGNSTPELQKFTGITFEDATFDFDGQEHEIVCKGVPAGANVQYTNNKAILDGEYKAKAVITKDGYETLTLTATMTINMSAEAVVQARANAVAQDNQNYDFLINLQTVVSGLALNGYYDAQYRYQKSTNNLSFMRTTSGSLLYDAYEWIYNDGESKIKLKADQDGIVDKIIVLPENEEELNLLNLPFSAIVDGINANNLTAIERIEGEYQYKANLALASETAVVQKLFEILGGLGAKVEIKGVEFANPAAGIDFYFSMNEDRTLLTAFQYSTELTFPVKGVPVTLVLNYKQKESDTEIDIPEADLINHPSPKLFIFPNKLSPH